MLTLKQRRLRAAVCYIREVKLLDGKLLAGFIKERHARQVTQLIAEGLKPKLAIVQTKDDPVINTYVRLKQEYGSDIGVDVDIHKSRAEELKELINRLNTDKTVYGIIVQLPLTNPEMTEDIVSLVSPKKDVDALGDDSWFEAATPMAIMWLLAGYNIDLVGKKILLIGRGKLVGAPLEKILLSSGYDVTVIDREVSELSRYTKNKDVIITATGSPAILYPDMVQKGAVIVDAGVASESGKTVGDLAPEMFERKDLTITPEKGGVGPLTVCALFENVILATERSRQ